VCVKNSSLQTFHIDGKAGLGAPLVGRKYLISRNLLQLRLNRCRAIFQGRAWCQSSLVRVYTSLDPSLTVLYAFLGSDNFTRSRGPPQGTGRSRRARAPRSMSRRGPTPPTTATGRTLPSPSNPPDTSSQGEGGGGQYPPPVLIAGLGPSGCQEMLSRVCVSDT